MIRFTRAITAAALRATAEGVERAALAVEPLGYDPRGARIIPPPKMGRWAIWSVPFYPATEDRLIGRYRMRWVARFIARRLVVPHQVVRYEVRPVDQRGVATGSSSSPCPTPGCTG